MSGAECTAFVLHRRDYRETSLLLELLAPDLGRCAAIARGARRPRDPASALLQPFQPLWLCLAGRGEVKTLTRVETAERAPALTGVALACGFYLNELLMRLLPRQDPQPELFARYRATLERLAREREPDGALRQFELCLLAELGYGVTLDREAGGGPVRAGVRYRHAPELGGVRRLDGAPTARGGNGPIVSGDTLLALAADLPLAPESRREARDLLRAALAPHLGERPLKSRELFRRLALPAGPDAGRAAG